MDNPSPSPPQQLSAADDLEASITDLLGQLVRIPSRARVDSCDRILAFVADWLRRHDVPCRALMGRDGRAVGITGQIGGAAGRGVYILNATADTVGFGDLAAWTRDPTGAEIADGWLYGRGSADTKAGMAIFCHLLAAFRPRSFAAALGFIFDATV
jgi:succinyl-diaminopimelate desuccinylase